jgi:two-component system cell cycle sensor histidine kinase/response regulator CckA
VGGDEPSPCGNVGADAGTESRRGDLARWLREAQSAAALEHLAAHVVQEYNHLLAALISAAGLLSEGGVDNSADSADVENLIVSVRDSSRIARQLVVLGGGTVTPPSVIDPNSVVASVAAMMRRLISRDVELVTDTTPNCWAVLADPGKIAQALLNLATNARDAMPQGGRLRLRTENVVVLDGEGSRGPADVATGEYVALIVEDSGIGIPAADQTRIFDPLFTTRCRGKHRGLGLATVAGIVRQTGGYVSVESTEGEGSTFTMLLPRDARNASVENQSPSAPLAHQGELILVVEEDGAVRLSMKRLLEDLGYRVRAVAGHARAIDLLKTSGEHFHLVISDVLLPELHRRVLGTLVNDSGDGPQVLYMFARSDFAMLVQGLWHPGITLLRKPFSAYSLAEAVARSLDARR